MARVKNARKTYKKKSKKLLQKSHTPEAIQHACDHQGKGQYLGEFVYGAIDGTISTFAVVAGATGATLSPVVVLILGFANLTADAFSMACSNFLSERAEREFIARERRREQAV